MCDEINSIAALYGGGAPDGGSVSSGGSGGGPGGISMNITKYTTTTVARMIAAIMMNLMTKVFVSDIYVLSLLFLPYEDNNNCIVVYTIYPKF